MGRSPRNIRGFVSLECLLLSAIMVIGLIPGLVAVQKAHASELSDTAFGIEALDQSFSYQGLQYLRGVDECSAGSAGSGFGDEFDGRIVIRRSEPGQESDPDPDPDPGSLPHGISYFAFRLQDAVGAEKYVKYDQIPGDVRDPAFPVQFFEHAEEQLRLMGMDEFEVDDYIIKAGNRHYNNEGDETSTDGWPEAGNSGNVGGPDVIDLTLP